MLSLFEIAAAMLVLSALFGWANHAFLKLPHTIGLLIMALVTSFVLLGLQVAFPALGLTDTVQSAVGQIDFNETVMNGMLAFLLFAGALHVDMALLKSRRWAIGMMATIGVCISTAIVGTGFYLATQFVGLNIPFIWALVFGALISPTDPVAVLSILKSVTMPRELEAKIAGESLFNDGVGVVIFTIILAIALGSGHAESMGVFDVVELFLVEAVGGAILGFIAGWLAYKAMAMIDEHAIEILITLGIVAGTYALAGRIQIFDHHLSGPIAVVVAGLMIGNKGAEFAMSEKTRTYLFSFWEMIDEILNSVLFLLIGLEILILGNQLNLGPALLLICLSIPLVLAARCVAVTVPIKFLGIFKSFTKGAIPVLTWGGLRGGISVALALSLPDTVAAKPVILTATYGIVIFSIIVQGLTVKNVVQRTVDPKLL